jgi:Zn-dependent peptidase ImmA (M78 family)
MSTLERGFKSWAERLAGGIRRDLDLAPHAPLPPPQLAEYLDVRLWTPHDVPGLPAKVLDQLLEKDPWGWSAVTQTIGDRITVIYNPRHSPGRRASNITHELAHVLLDHEPSKVILSPDGGIIMRTFDVRQEDEAGWLSGCLLLPRVALIHAIRRGLSVSDTAEEYGVSEVLLNYRTRITGVAAQAARSTRRKSTSPHRS